MLMLSRTKQILEPIGVQNVIAVKNNRLIFVGIYLNFTQPTKVTAQFISSA